MKPLIIILFFLVIYPGLSQLKYSTQEEVFEATSHLEIYSVYYANADITGERVEVLIFINPRTAKLEAAGIFRIKDPLYLLEFWILENSAWKQVYDHKEKREDIKKKDFIIDIYYI